MLTRMRNIQGNHKVLLDGVDLHTGRIGTAELLVEKVTGWRESPPIKGDHDERHDGHGALPTQRFYGARTVTIDGVVLGRDAAQREQALEVVRRAGESRSLTRLTIKDFVGTAYANVVGAGMIPDEVKVSQSFTRYSLVVTAPDPFKYGDWQDPVESVNGTDVRVFHRGNADSAPLVSVTGSAPNGYEISYEGREFFDVLTPLSSGQMHVVDFNTGRAYFGDTVLTDYGRAKAIRVRRGAPQIMSVQAFGSGNVTGIVDVQDTWI